MFRFKHFEIDDSHSAMKIGTDGVLLGAWARVDGCGSVLDVGTGTGLIALMVAQRSAHAAITAIDIDAAAASEARHNADGSPWGDRIVTLHADIRSFSSSQRFDHIVSNPPYFIDSMLSPDAARSMARHTMTLSFEELVDAAERLLCDGGRLSVVLPVDGAARFRRVAFGRLWLSRQCDVYSREGELPRRVLMEFVRTTEPLMPRCNTLAIYEANGGYTEKYRRLTEDFYLSF